MIKSTSIYPPKNIIVSINDVIHFNTHLKCVTHVIFITYVHEKYDFTNAYKASLNVFKKIALKNNTL